MSTKKRPAYRTVKNGKVRLYGIDYVPFDWHRPYAGELEGQRLLFFPPNPYTQDAALWHGGENNPAIIDGYLYWMSWKPEAVQP